MLSSRVVQQRRPLNSTAGRTRTLGAPPHSMRSRVGRRSPEGVDAGQAKSGRGQRRLDVGWSQAGLRSLRQNPRTRDSGVGGRPVPTLTDCTDASVDLWGTRADCADGAFARWTRGFEDLFTRRSSRPRCTEGTGHSDRCCSCTDRADWAASSKSGTHHLLVRTARSSSTPCRPSAAAG